MVFLEILQNSQESTYGGVSFLIKLLASNDTLLMYAFFHTNAFLLKNILQLL